MSSDASNNMGFCDRCNLQPCYCARVVTGAASAPPQLCTGAGLIPPLHQGMVAASSLGWCPAPCAICGQVVPVDSFQRTVNHPYLPTADALARQLAGDFGR
jgi:hypothetical protein